MKAFKKQLNNMIIEWENLYGDFYNLLYTRNDDLRKFDSIGEFNALTTDLNIARTVMQVLKKLKRNMYYMPKKEVKRKYKVEQMEVLKKGNKK